MDARRPRFLLSTEQYEVLLAVEGTAARAAASAAPCSVFFT